MSSVKDSLTLKWGTLKGYSIATPEFRAALEKFHEDPVSMSAATQSNTDAQKQALCEAIDACNGDIWNDWSGNKMSKNAAREYVMGYDRS